MSRILIVRATGHAEIHAGLANSGYTVETVTDAPTALSRSREVPPTVLLCDAAIASAGDFAFLRAWRSDARLEVSPFVVVAGAPMSEDDEYRMLEHGADSLIRYDSDPLAIAGRIARILSGSEEDTTALLTLSQTTESDDSDTGQRLGHKLRDKLRELDLLRATLRNNEDLYRSLFDSPHFPMLLTEPASGQILDVNPAAVGFYGWSREEILTRTLNSLKEPTDQEIDSPIDLDGSDDSTYSLLRHRRADGSVRDVELYRFPVTVAGRCLSFVLTHDVTERLAAEAKLSFSENLIRFSATLAKVGGWELDVAADRVYWSDEVCRMHGVPADTVLSLQESLDYCAPEYRSGLRKAIEDCLTIGSPYNAEFRIVRRDNTSLWVQALGEPVRDDQGRIQGIRGAFQEIDSLISAQEELRRLRYAVDQSPASVIITDRAPRIVYVNDAACRISGYRRDELLGQNPRILQSSRTPRDVYASLWQSLELGRPWTGVFYNRRKNGTEYVESASVSPVQQTDGRITHYLAVKEDITEKRRNERELRRYRHQLEQLVEQRTQALTEARRQAESANHAKSAFLANMSHEIRTPMNGVLGLLELLEATPLDDNQKDIIATVQDSGRALMQIIEDILDFSKIEAGRLELERTAFSLRETVEGLIESLIPLGHSRGVDLNVFVAPELPRLVVGDDVRLRQILYNLIGNAIKFSGGREHTRGRVRVAVVPAATDGQEIDITIEDNGIGIDPEQRSRLFQPFAQAEQSTTRRYGGSGLGLIICKRLVDLMKGQIALDSTPGAGSTFSVTLPLEPAAEQPEPASARLSGYRCVLVEHDALDTEGLRAYLAGAGAEVACSATLDEAQAPADQSAVIISFDENLSSDAPEIDSASGARHVLISRGRRPQPRLLAPHCVAIECTTVRRSALIDAVVAATGDPTSISTQTADVATADQDTPIPERARQRPMILVAEDDEISRKVITRQLERLGHRAHVAKDGEEALERFRSGEYGLVLTDLHMPKLDGYALTKAIRHHEEQAGTEPAGPGRLPIIALTANAIRGEAERARQRGFDDYLTKPLQLERLREALDHWLTRSAAVQPAESSSRDGLPKELPLLDVSVLKELVGEDSDIVAEFLTDYLESAEGMQTDFQRACDVADPRQVAAIAHKLKSSSRSVGAMRLGALCEELEHAGKSGTIRFHCGRATELHRELDAVRAAIRQYLNTDTTRLVG